jgi:DNA-binding response OmpR family regulator
MIVLAVDDERDVTESIAESLKLKGHEVLCAESADSAMKILQNRFQSREPVSVILSDLLMPDISGEAFFTMVRQDSHLSNIPFAIMSGNAAPDQIKKLVLLGVDGVICKPFTVDALEAALEATIKRRGDKDVAEMLKGLKMT